MDYILYGGIAACLIVGIILLRKAFKNPLTKIWYTKPGSGAASVTSNYFSDSRISFKRKFFVLLLPFILLGGAILIIILATIYKIL